MHQTSPLELHYDNFNSQTWRGQISPSKVERIIAYFLQKLHDAEIRYSTYDKELLGVCDAIEYWKYYLKSGRKFHVQTDHSALQHTLNQPKLSGRQMRLLKTLQEYDFDIEYYPGARNYIQDALSRRSDYKQAPIPLLHLAGLITHIGG